MNYMLEVRERCANASYCILTTGFAHLITLDDNYGYLGTVGWRIKENTIDVWCAALENGTCGVNEIAQSRRDCTAPIAKNASAEQICRCVLRVLSTRIYSIHDHCRLCWHFATLNLGNGAL